MRGLLRLLMLRDNAALPDSDWQALLRLRSHADDFRKAGGSGSGSGSGSELWDNICLMSQAAAHYSGTKMDEHLVRGLFCKVCSVSSLSLSLSFARDFIGICFGYIIFFIQFFNLE